MEGFRPGSSAEKREENVSREERLNAAEKNVYGEFENLRQTALDRIGENPYFTELQ